MGQANPPKKPNPSVERAVVKIAAPGQAAALMAIYEFLGPEKPDWNFSRAGEVFLPVETIKTTPKGQMEVLYLCSSVNAEWPFSEAFHRVAVGAGFPIWLTLEGNSALRRMDMRQSYHRRAWPFPDDEHGESELLLPEMAALNEFVALNNIGSPLALRYSLKYEYEIIWEGAEIKKRKMRYEPINSLSLSDEGISDLSPLGHLNGLRFLALPGNRISDLSPLAGCPAIEALELYDNRIQEVSPLAGLKNLRSLNVIDNPLDDLSPLLACPALASLYLSAVPAKALASLKGANFRILAWFPGAESKRRSH